MSLFGFDAFLDWEGVESTIFWCCVALFAPVFVSVTANILMHHFAWPQSRRIR